MDVAAFDAGAADDARVTIRPVVAAVGAVVVATRAHAAFGAAAEVTDGRDVGLRRPSPAASRFVKAIKSSATQATLQFLVVGPQQAVEVQGQRDKRSVLGIDFPAQASGLHPSADGNGAFLDETEPGQQLVETIKQLGFIQG